MCHGMMREHGNSCEMLMVSNFQSSNERSNHIKFIVLNFLKYLGNKHTQKAMLTCKGGLSTRWCSSVRRGGSPWGSPQWCPSPHPCWSAPRTSPCRSSPHLRTSPWPYAGCGVPPQEDRSGSRTAALSTSLPAHLPFRGDWTPAFCRTPGTCVSAPRHLLGRWRWQRSPCWRTWWYWRWCGGALAPGAPFLSWQQQVLSRESRHHPSSPDIMWLRRQDLMCEQSKHVE